MRSLLRNLKCTQGAYFDAAAEADLIEVVAV